ncbi:MAG: hypothetical protein KVP17_001807 [Porospora cf. gigantea B]|uniref:uncharacterized protein n=1 Tax=Porospora cf. gigantea B TaxID=2853592 RepID=UPI0035717AA6|nr:MAG: hypothetical protein KVP17_001807 [Porospora cf. gigantea B]
MDRPLAPRRPSLKDVDFTVPTLEQQLKQVTDGPTVEKVEAPVNPYIEALIPGLEEAPQGDAVSPDLANVSKAIRDLIGDVDVKTAVSYAKEGGYLLKHCRNRLKKPHDRLFWVDMEVLAIRWTSPQKRKKASETIIYLTDVDLILPGEDSDYFKKRKKEERALGIELVAHTSKLRVVCKNYPEWRMWLRGLLYAHQKALTKRKRTSSLTNEYIRKIWLTADQDNSGSIQFNELIDLLQQLHVQMDLRYAEKLFCSYDEDGSHVLEYDEFKQLLHRLLTHEDILVYFDMFKHSAQRVMTAENYQQFLLEVQKTPPSSIPDAMKHLNGMGDPFRKNKNLTDWGFSLLLTSEANSIIHPNKQFVYQEMNRPLHEYWVASSHNTYLTGDQVSSKSSVGQYIDVLLKGCRCVELDCWDGPYGEPIIYHGHTLTKKISFSAVLQACKDYGFKKSSYPIILSLEMHCSARQKARVGQLLVEILGHQIYTPDRELWLPQQCSNATFGQSGESAEQIHCERTRS